MESLGKRDGHSGRHTLLLWIHYNLSILKHLQGKTYLLINYRDILKQFEAAEELSRLFSCKLNDALKRTLDHVIKPGYCHSDYSYEDVRNTQNELLSDLYVALLKNRETEADVSEWEKRYQAEAAKTADQFMDYEVLQNIRCLEEKEIHKHGTTLMNGTVYSIAEIENRKNLLVIVAIGSKMVRKEVEYTLAYIEGLNFLSFFALEKVLNKRRINIEGND